MALGHESPLLWFYPEPLSHVINDLFLVWDKSSNPSTHHSINQKNSRLLSYLFPLSSTGLWVRWQWKTNEGFQGHLQKGLDSLCKSSSDSMYFYFTSQILAAASSTSEFMLWVSTFLPILALQISAWLWLWWGGCFCSCFLLQHFWSILIQENCRSFLSILQRDKQYEEWCRYQHLLVPRLVLQVSVSLPISL